MTRARGSGPAADVDPTNRAGEGLTLSRRCPWAEGSDAYRAYHDDEGGVPVRVDRVLCEFLLLEGAQAGLAWSTILAKR